MLMAYVLGKTQVPNATAWALLVSYMRRKHTKFQGAGGLFGYKGRKKTQGFVKFLGAMFVPKRVALELSGYQLFLYSQLRLK